MTRSTIGLLAGFVALVVLVLIPPPEGLSSTATRAAGVTLLMAAWWMTEAIPIPATFARSCAFMLPSHVFLREQTPSAF